MDCVVKYIFYDVYTSLKNITPKNSARTIYYNFDTSLFCITNVWNDKNFNSDANPNNIFKNKADNWTPHFVSFRLRILCLFFHEIVRNVTVRHLYLVLIFFFFFCIFYFNSKAISSDVNVDLMNLNNKKLMKSYNINVILKRAFKTLNETHIFIL